jgi:small conductance mechanosensitive channel
MCKVDMEFSVSYADEIEQIEKVFLEIINADERVLQDPEPNIRLSKLGDSRVIFLVRPLV